MASDPIFSTLPSSGSSEPGYSDTAVTIGGADWYAPTSLPFVDSYLTPYTTSMVDGQAWGVPAKSSMADLHMMPYNFAAPNTTLSSYYLANAPGRPRSSPSTFGPSPESINWSNSNGLGINYNTEATLAQSTIPSHSYDTFPTQKQYTAPNTPEICQPIPRRPYQSIAPNPLSIPTATKRRSDDIERSQSTTPPGKRRKRTASVASIDLSEDDRYLVRLKEDESLPWKEIAIRFQTDKGKTFQVAALQMRYKRLREKHRVWEDQDVSALKLAHEYWAKYKWEIISQKMTEFGNPERWPARQCARKWQELELTASSVAAVNAGMASHMGHLSTSPVEASMRYGFMPLR